VTEVCREWTQPDGLHFRGKCGNEFMPKTGSDGCNVCVNPVRPLPIYGCYGCSSDKEFPSAYRVAGFGVTPPSCVGDINGLITGADETSTHINAYNVYCHAFTNAEIIEFINSSLLFHLQNDVCLPEGYSLANTCEWMSETRQILSYMGYRQAFNNQYDTSVPDTYPTNIYSFSPGLLIQNPAFFATSPYDVVACHGTWPVPGIHNANPPIEGYPASFGAADGITVSLSGALTATGRKPFAVMGANVNVNGGGEYATGPGERRVRVHLKAAAGGNMHLQITSVNRRIQWASRYNKSLAQYANDTVLNPVAAIGVYVGGSCNMFKEMNYIGKPDCNNLRSVKLAFVSASSGVSGGMTTVNPGVPSDIYMVAD